MIPTLITAVIFFITFILHLVKVYVKPENEKVALAQYVSFIILCMSLFITIVMVIGLGVKPKYNLKERELIEYKIKYEEVYNPQTIDDIREFNKSVNAYNSYWYRFTIEDRSIYLIDENEYLSKFNK